MAESKDEKLYTTVMEGMYDDPYSAVSNIRTTCICMWGEVHEKLTEAGGGRNLMSFRDMTKLFYHELEEYAIEYATKGDEAEVASGDIPFFVQFCSPDWLPQLKELQHKALLAYFCNLKDAVTAPAVEGKDESVLSAAAIASGKTRKNPSFPSRYSCSAPPFTSPPPATRTEPTRRRTPTPPPLGYARPQKELGLNATLSRCSHPVAPIAPTHQLT